MTAVLIISIVLVWMFISGVIVVSVSMMSSRLSHREEFPSQNPRQQMAPTSLASATSNGIPTQPRAEIVR